MTFVRHCLFLISSSSDAPGRLCFMVFAFLRIFTYILPLNVPHLSLFDAWGNLCFVIVAVLRICTYILPLNMPHLFLMIPREEGCAL